MNHIPSQYRLLGKIGEGSGGEVYAAWNTHLNQKVVLKKIKASAMNVQDHRAEVDVLKKLRHSYLPKVLDFIHSGNDVYTVMDFIPGESFTEPLKRGEYFDEKYVIRWARQICETLVYLHSQTPPIIHSDLKPGNIMLMPNGDICVIDFNIAASLQGDGAAVTGYTRGYAPPEQVRALRYNQREPDPSRWMRIDPRADIYSLGATLYHILTGERPAQNERGYTMDIRRRRPEINPVLAAIVMRCLEPDPARRYQSAQALLTDLEGIHQKDHRYRSMVLRQRLTYGILGVLLVGFAGLSLAGVLRMRQDKSREYDALVRKEQRCAQDGDYEGMEASYQDAVKLEPNRMGAYLEKAIALEMQGRYQDNIDFIETEVLNNQKLVKTGESLEDIYYLLGNAYDQLEDYRSAAAWYEDAIELRPDYGPCYRNYAIALANLGDTDGAREALDRARENQVENTNLLFVEAEILYHDARYQEAKEKFLQCVAQTESIDEKQRAYLKAAECLDSMGKTQENLVEKVNLLDEASLVLPQENNHAVLEKLGEAYLELVKVSGNSGYYYNAIDAFQQLVDRGDAGYTTYSNLEQCYKQVKEFDKSAAVLDDMLDRFGENYRTYRDYAYLDYTRQQGLPEGQRSYETFRSHYLRAQELYQSSASGNANDPDMERLKELYSSLVEARRIAG